MDLLKKTQQFHFKILSQGEGHAYPCQQFNAFPTAWKVWALC